MNRADHHADDVNEIVLALIGGVIWRAEGNLIATFDNQTPISEVKHFFAGI